MSKTDDTLAQLDKIAFRLFGLTGEELIQQLANGELTITRVSADEDESDAILPPGIPGDLLLNRARDIAFDPADLAEIEHAIEEDCEKVDVEGW